MALTQSLYISPQPNESGDIPIYLLPGTSPPGKPVSDLEESIFTYGFLRPTGRKKGPPFYGEFSSGLQKL